uniref:Uncharacterized protein n=1 Tax=biofilter metagenome TaxID=1070537 RepID=A0A1A7GE93_9ZZZZ
MADIITVTFDPPQLSDTPAVFDSKAQASVNKFPQLIGEMNNAGVIINGLALDAENAASDAELAQEAAEEARDAALAAATAIADDYDAGGHAYGKGNLAWDGPGKLYRCILAYNSTATRPAADPTHWARVNVTPDDVAAIVAAGIDVARDVPTVTKSGALALTDRGRVVRANGAITIPAQASVAWPEGATMPVRNITGAAISLTPATDVTLRKDGTTKTGALSIPAYRTITLHRDATNSWFASGAE